LAQLYDQVVRAYNNMTRTHGRTESLFSARGSLLEVVAVAVCIALGVNCLAAGIVLLLTAVRGKLPLRLVTLGESVESMLFGWGTI
jgi:hypothetical protein